MDNTVLIIISLVFAVVAGTSIYLIFGAGQSRQMRKRMQRYTDPTAVKREEAVAARSIRAAEAHSMAPTLDEKLRRLIPNADQFRFRVERAGFNFGMSTALLILGGFMVFFTMVFMGLMGLSFGLALMAGIAAGLAFPTLLVSMRTAKRLKQFTIGLPDAIDLMVRNVRSGLPVAEGIHSVANDLSGPVAEEFQKISSQIKIGVNMETALDQAVRRIGATDFAFLTIALSIQKETGGNLSEALGNLSRLLRQRNQMHLKIRALTSEARSSAMIIGVLPFVVIGALLLLNPDYIRVLYEDPTGRIVSGVGLTSMIIGYLVMAKMVRFQI